ncbi:MAG: S-layer homology domain-containing protein, partial [Chloroflexia bacterium]
MSGNGLFNAVQAFSANDVWAAGYYYDGLFNRTLVGRYNDPCGGLTGTPTRTSTPTATPTCGPSVSLVSSPNAGPLRGLTVLSSSNAWAAGETGILHWDGAAWTQRSSVQADLYGLVAVSPDDIWAVGDTGYGYRTVTMHWDGSAWTQVPSPSPGVMGNQLYAVTALSTNDVWAVGSYNPSATVELALTLHWDGTAWTQVPLEGAGDGQVLRGVVAFAPNDVWVAGYSNTFMIGDRTFFAHWDGSHWTVVQSPNPGSESWIYALAAVGTNNLIAVGSYYNVSSRNIQTLAMRWSGTAWSVVPTASLGSYSNNLYGVAAIGNDIWAAGTYQDNTGPQRTLVLRNGIVVLSPNADSGFNQLDAVAGASPDDVWMVGEHGVSQHGPSLVERAVNACGTPSPTPTITPTPACLLAWNPVDSPNVGAGSNYLRDVSALSETDVWAVGYYHNTTTNSDESLTEHWDGTHWSIAQSPNPGHDTRLYGVKAISANDAWAVGVYNNSLATLTIHWDGSAWTQVQSASPGDNYANWLNAVDGVSGGDLWAVGFWRRYSPQALIERFAGSSWVQVTNPTTGSVDNFADVKAAASNDVWAVGMGNSASLIAHWDGSSWSFVSCPNVGGLTGIDGVAANDLWAVGASGILHWDGSNWTINTTAISGLTGITVINPTNAWAVGSTGFARWNGTQWSLWPDVPAGPLTKIAAVSLTDAWAVGSRFDGFVDKTLTERYHNSCQSGTITPTPTATSTTPTPTGTPLTCAVINGSIDNSDLLMNGRVVLGGPVSNCATGPLCPGAADYVPRRYDVYTFGNLTSSDQCVTITLNAPSCTGRNAIYSAAYYIVDPSNSCANYLGGAVTSPSGSYSIYVICCARGHFSIVVSQVEPDAFCSSYTLTISSDTTCSTPATPTPTGTIRPSPTRTPTPSATATRRPSGTPGLTSTYTPTGSPSGTPLPCTIAFTDVLPTDYFYEAVTYLYCHGAISGYADNTFRPYNFTTRGQLAKIVVLAEGWTIYTPPYPRFIDVPPTHPFYSYVETAYSRGIISGYACGAGCLEFRPGNNVTRAQLSKIVVLAENWAITPPSTPTFRDVQPEDG